MPASPTEPLLFHSLLAPDAEHVRAIGEVVVRWAQLESSLEMLIWELAPLEHPFGHALTSHMNAQQWLQVVKSLANERLRDHPLLSSLLALIRDIDDSVRVRRNEVAHSQWMPTGKAGVIQTFQTTARGKIQFKVGSEMSAYDILKVAADVDKANWELTRLSFDIAEHLGRLTEVSVGPDGVLDLTGVPHGKANVQ
jgi:hypothetical protein